MPKFTDERFGLEFTVPDKPSILQVLTYDSKHIELLDQPELLALWEMAKTIIDDWKCDALPDPEIDILKLDDLHLIRLIEFVGMKVSGWRFGLDEVPKN